MAQQSKQPMMWAGMGISMGAGLGTIIGLLGWGATGIALGAGFGAGIGLVVGAMADSLRAP